MTTLIISFKGKDVTATVDVDAGVACANKELLGYMQSILDMYRVKPIVNVEPWMARLIAGHFGGRITDEPPFNRDAKDVI